jgi:hypothetical protein
MFANKDEEFSRLHLPSLINYVVLVLQEPSEGAVSVGSGVLVKIGERHFLATAAHCLEGRIRVARSLTPLRADQGVEGTRGLRVIRMGRHANRDLDVGFVEIADPLCPELSLDQFTSAGTEQSLARFIGYPSAMVERVSVDGKPRSIALTAASFGTSFIERTEDRLFFNYPEAVQRYDLATKTQIESQLPPTPHGFSGGACFSVREAESSVASLEYRLLGIQSAWLPQSRRLCVVPIERWLEMAADDFTSPSVVLL